MKLAIGVVLLLTLPVSLGPNALAASSCPTSQYDPRSYDGEVTPPSAPDDVHFSYIADVEVPPDCKIRKIECIENLNDSADLWVRWPAAQIYHDTPWNFLAPQRPALQDQGVPGFDPAADPNAPIEYTQKPIIQGATIYHARSASDCRANTTPNSLET